MPHDDEFPEERMWFLSWYLFTACELRFSHTFVRQEQGYLQSPVLFFRHAQDIATEIVARHLTLKSHRICRPVAIIIAAWVGPGSNPVKLCAWLA